MRDVAIIGGGPAGSTVGGFIKRYKPDADVLILEKERFPREHVGESHLQPLTQILEELGAWEKVEAADFPVKVGAVYRWGRTDDLWRFDFLASEDHIDPPRPGRLEGVRRETTYHVRRAEYDQILLDHAESLGCEVRQECRVAEVEMEGDRAAALILENGERIEARWIVDASGHNGVIRRAAGVEVDAPTQLRNVAFWNYWRRPEWAEGVCRGGTHVRIMSVGFGWLWFIPQSADAVSCGLVTSAAHYKASGLRPEELYAQALAAEPWVAAELAEAEDLGRFAATKDWSFLSSRMTGDNWFLVGESAGFADPILSAGMTLAQVGGRELAHILIGLLEESVDQEWIVDWYEKSQTKRIRQHIRFADYWYSANAHFSELKEYTSEIAKEAGLSLAPEDGFRWLAAGGFLSDDLAAPVVGTFRLGSAKFLMQILSNEKADWALNRCNEVRLNLVGARQVLAPQFKEGRIEPIKCWSRDNRLLPLFGLYRILVSALQQEKDLARVLGMARQQVLSSGLLSDPADAMTTILDALEGMLAEGWLKGSVNKKRPMPQFSFDESSSQVRRLAEA